MKTIIGTLTGLFFSVTTYSQSTTSLSANDSIPCSINVEVDTYSGKKTIETGFVDFTGGNYKLSKDKGIINLWVQIESNVHLIIDAGEIFYIKFTDNTIMKFMIISKDYGDYSPYEDKYTNSFIFNLSGKKLETLKSKKIQGIKCYINEYSFSDNTAENFKNDLNCISKTK